MPPIDLHKYLFIEYDTKINKITPLITKIWKQDPKNIDKIITIQKLYPNQDAIKLHLDYIIKVLDNEGFKPLQGQNLDKSNTAHVKQLMSQVKEGYSTLEIGQYGEYAPCIAAALCGVKCYVVKKDKQPDNKGVRLALKDEFEVLTGYTKKFETIEEKSGGLSKSELHKYWYNASAEKPVQKLFKYSVITSAENHKDKLGPWANRIDECAPKSKDNDAKWMNSKVNDLNQSKSSKKQYTISYLIWIRHVKPLKHSHNMTLELLHEISSALGHVSRHTYGLKANYNIILFGDSSAQHTMDLPRKIKISNYDNPSIMVFIEDVFLEAWDNKPPDVNVIDFRSYYANAGPFTIAADIDSYPNDNNPPRNRNLTYSEQYMFYIFITHTYNPKFIVGVESGNMDGFGYVGIPVISVEPTDAVTSIDKNILNDRIGNYTLLTPLWQLVNYGEGDEKFRPYLYGAMLTYTKYGKQ